MGGSLMSRLIIVGAGLLYPAYASYKAVKGADVRQYVRWMMYWVVFALFSATESITDIFLSWLPLYYELKVFIVLWLMLPYSKGSSTIYRKLIHPNLSKREEEIDLFLENARERSYETVVNVGAKGINLAANAVVHAAVKGQSVVSSTLKSYSVTDLTSLPEQTEIHRQPNVPLINPPIAHERNAMSANPMVTFDPATETDGESSRMRDFSMTDLNQGRSSDFEAEATNVLSSEFSTVPPAYTTDDMQITQRTSHTESIANPDEFTSHYATLPRPKKGEKLSSQQMTPLPQADSGLRRSKRKQNPVIKYEELSD